MSTSTNVPLGRAPLWAGPAWDSDGKIKEPWMRWFNSITQNVVATNNNQPGQAVIGPISPSNEAIAITVLGLLSQFQNPISSMRHQDPVDMAGAISHRQEQQAAAIGGPFGIGAGQIIGLLGSLGLTFDQLGNVIITGKLTVDGTSDLKGNVKAEGTLEVDSTSDLKGAVHVEASLQVDTTSDLKGAVHMEASLQVDTTSDLKGNVTCEGTLEVDSTSDLKGLVTMEGTFEASGGLCTVSGGFAVIGDSSATGKIQTDTGFEVTPDLGESVTITPAFATLVFEGGILTSNT